MSEIETLFSRLIRESAKGGTTSPQTKTALIKLGVALNSYTMDLPIGDYSYVAHRWDTRPHDGVVGLWVDFDIANRGRNTIYLKCSQLADCELTPEVDAGDFPGYDHWEGRIKTLMNDVGMPDSQSLATPGYTVEQIAQAAMEAEISDSKFESIVIALQGCDE